MKAGRNLTELAAEIMRRSNAKADYVVESRALRVDRPLSVEGDVAVRRPIVAIAGAGSYGITEHAHGQLAEKTRIPKPYYDRLLADDTALWQTNVNHWLAASDDRRMVRTLDNTMRALLSDRYQRIDNEHVAEVALPLLLETDSIRIASCDITDRRLYLKATFPLVQAEVKKGDVVQAGVIIGNSEIGDGSLYVDPFIERLACLNGARFTEMLWRRTHVGGRIELPAGVVLAEDTMRAEDSAILLRMRDMIRAASGEVFQRIVQKMQAAANTRPVAHPTAAVQVLGKSVGLLQGERESVLERLIQGRDYTLYGMANAITNLANDVESYDRASELETIGGKVFTLAPSEWRRVAEAELAEAA